MNYLVFALKSEAQAFIDRYKLDAKKCNDFITIIISGMGSDNMYKATKELLLIASSNDNIINIGICGASSKFKIGELLEINIQDSSIDNRGKLSCVNCAISNPDIYDAVDMESEGFLKATKSFKNRYMFKIVSDNFQPDTVSKDMAKKLIFDKIDEIMKRVSK